MRITDVGTTAILLLNPNPRRKRWQVQFLPNSVDAGNSGSLFISKGEVPSGVVGSPSQGEALVPGAGIDEADKTRQEDFCWKGSVWAVAANADQTIVFDEEIWPE